MISAIEANGALGYRSTKHRKPILAAGISKSLNEVPVNRALVLSTFQVIKDRVALPRNERLDYWSSWSAHRSAASIPPVNLLEM